MTGGGGGLGNAGAMDAGPDDGQIERLAHASEWARTASLICRTAMVSM
jgi:hypothetical protein